MHQCGFFTVGAGHLAAMRQRAVARHEETVQYASCNVNYRDDTVSASVAIESACGVRHRCRHPTTRCRGMCEQNIGVGKRQHCNSASTLAGLSRTRARKLAVSVQGARRYSSRSISFLNAVADSTSDPRTSLASRTLYVLNRLLNVAFTLD